MLFSEENSGFVDKILLWNNSAEAYVRNSGPVAIGNIARTGINLMLNQILILNNRDNNNIKIHVRVWKNCKSLYWYLSLLGDLGDEANLMFISFPLIPVQISSFNHHIQFLHYNVSIF